MAEKADRLDDLIFDTDDEGPPPSAEERARFRQELIESIRRSMNDPRPDITMEEMRAYLDDLKIRARNR